MRILIIKLGAIGDVIRTTCILQGILEKYKNCSIDWVAKKESFEVLKNNKLIGKIFFINDYKKILPLKYDLVVSLDDEPEACSLATSVNSKKIIGAYLNDSRRVYTKDSSSWFDMGIISRFGLKKANERKAENKKTYQEIIYKILELRYSKQEPVLILSEKGQDFAKNFAVKNNISKNDLVIGINTGAGGRWENKKLSEEKTTQLVGSLNSKLKNARLILFGGPEEKERNGRIKKMVKTNIIDAGCSNSLMEFASLVNLCSLIVTSDSLALHVATALKKNIVAFFCPTSSSEIELYGRGIKIIPKTGCLCCYKPKCKISPEYDVDEIVWAVSKLLNYRHGH